jgi:hypothetical protein
VNCPKCQAEIPLADANVASDIALCRKCQESSPRHTWQGFTELARDEAIPEVDLNRPPKGMWLKRAPSGFELGSSTRSGIAFFLIPFMCLWSGGSIGGIYGTQIAKGHFNLALSLFGLPFVLGTIILAGFTLMTIAGKVCVRRNGPDGELFAGVGSLGFRKRFKWDQVKSIRRITRIGPRGHPSQQICLQLTNIERPIWITSTNNRPRMDFLLGALNQLHREFLLGQSSPAPLMAGTLVPAPPGAKPPIAA